MTYFGFLAIFLGIPLAAMALLTWRDLRQGRSLPDALGGAPTWQQRYTGQLCRDLRH